MIVNVRPEEHGEVSDPHLLSYLEIWLDGQRQRGVLKADDKRGLVRRYALDQRGCIKHDNEDRPITEVVNGVVEIRLTEAAPEQVKTMFRELRALEAGV